MTPRRFTARVLVQGSAKGELLVSKRAFTFAHGVDPSTGEVTDVHSDLVGKNVKSKILVYPHGKGSTTASAWFLETVRQGNQPAAIITAGPDLSAVIGATVADKIYGKTIPVLSTLPGLFYETVKTGQQALVDGATAQVTLES